MTHKIVTADEGTYIAVMICPACGYRTTPLDTLCLINGHTVHMHCPNTPLIIGELTFCFPHQTFHQVPCEGSLVHKYSLMIYSGYIVQFGKSVDDYNYLKEFNPTPEELNLLTLGYEIKFED
jgi:hypothetical protein